MSATATIYDYIAKNNRNTVFLVMMFPASLAVIIYLLLFASFVFFPEGSLLAEGLNLAQLFKLSPYGPEDLQNQMELIPVAAVASLGYTLASVVPIFIFTSLWLLIAYFFGGKMILTAAGAKSVTKSQNPEIYRLVENVAIAAGLPTPRLYIIADDSLNAFATGNRPETASITLTTGILKKLSRQELEGVVAHEMAHIGNRDCRLMLIVIIGIGALSFLTELLMRAMSSMSKGNNNKNGGPVLLILLVIMVALIIFSTLVAPILRFALSRTREYAADTTAALITRNPKGLADALTKISTDARVENLDKMPTIGALCVADPLGKSRRRLFDSLSGLYSTHPPIDKRIAALTIMDSRKV